MAQLNMSLENYKKQVEKGLTEEVGKKEATRLMKEYEIDFPMFLKDGWETGVTITAMIMGY